MRLPRPLLRAPAALLALLALLRCDLLTATFFPDYLPRLKKSLDLSAYLGDKDKGAGSRIEVLANGVTERVAVLSWRPGLQPRLLFLDEDLRILADWDEQGVRAALGGATGAFGRPLMVDAAGDYLIGNFVFDSVTLQPLLSTDMLEPPIPAGATGVSRLGTENFVMWVDNGVNPARLEGCRSSAGWGAPSSFGYDLAPSAWSLSLERAMRTYEAPEIYCLVFGSYGSAVFLALPAARFEAGTLTTPLIDIFAPPYPLSALEDTRADSVQFTVDGFVVRRRDGKRQLWGDGRLKDSYNPSDSEADVEEAYSPCGEHYYALDHGRKELRKLAVWW